MAQIENQSSAITSSFASNVIRERSINSMKVDYQVSRIAKKLDELVNEFLNRPIEGSLPYLFVDASYFKVRTDGRYINKALLVVTAIRDDGYREILSATVADSEDESCWESCFDDLKARGLKSVKLVISDGHKGIQAAIEKAFLGAYDGYQ